ncbi:MAG: nucleotidyltransferase domain-containing protein [Anaerolineae bacterium]|nr:nucleotidyltransferase domain-containing protein [Anaerolineae bacterium]
MTLSDLRERREEILATAARHGAHNIRVFGSVARGDTNPESDVDLIVCFREGASIFDQVGLWLDLQELLGCEIDLIADHPSGGKFMQRALKEAVAL